MADRPAASLARQGVRWAWRAGRYRLLPRLAWGLGYLRSPRQMVAAWPEGEIPLGPKVAVFAHFDRAGLVREHVLAYVRALAEAGLSVVFVTNSGRLRPEAMAALRPICAGILIRRNIGYDFGAWRDALERLGLPRANTELVAIANDSVYGPLQPMPDVLDRLDLEDAEVWGLTESWQGRYHLQSYFVAFHPRVLGSLAWRAFWADVRPAPSKHWIIQRHEVGLTQAMIRGGFRVRALWPYPALLETIDAGLVVMTDEDARARDPLFEERRAHMRRLREAAVRRVPLNPTSDLWRQLLMAGFPFLKRELLRDNPTRVADVFDWRSVLATYTLGEAGPIERDMQRVLKNKAP